MRSDVLASDAFQPVSSTTERDLDAALTARMAVPFRSAGVGSLAFALPLGFDMVSFVASLSASSSGETLGGFDLEEEAVRAVGWRVLVVGGMMRK